MTRILFAAAAMLALTAPAGAETPAPDRYELKPVEGGFLRLDRQTGLTAVCRPSGEGYACRATDEGASAEAALVASLEKRVAELEAKVKALSGDAAAKQPSRDATLDLPSDEQIDRVAGFLERALQRLKKLSEQAPKEGDQKL
ncbi:hypothetical protein [Methylopila sp. M107]|uniref:hypothetical protein n=1 Tax=Methylopila sp. M107 TaxID=1101190 RepID=UPI0003818596|nr:hypothetical protein [Methylopila sp. M107]